MTPAARKPSSKRPRRVAASKPPKRKKTGPARRPPARSPSRIVPQKVEREPSPPPTVSSLPPPVPPPLAPPPTFEVPKPSSPSPSPKRFLSFLLLFALLLIPLSLLMGSTWWGLWYDFLLLLLPTGLAIFFLGGVRRKISAGLRLTLAIATAILVFSALAMGDPWLYTVESNYLYFLPVLGVLVVLGTGRYRWNPPQLFGAMLLLYSVWRPIYGSFPSLTQVFTASGVLEPYTIPELYRLVGIKFLREVFFVVVGLLLLFQRFPYVQKRPEGGRDLRWLLERVQFRFQPHFWTYLGFGGLVLLLAAAGSISLAVFLGQFETLQRGADDTQVFGQITPELVLLLSLAAGIGEELIFRGLLQPYFERGWSAVFPTRPTLAAGLAIFLQAVLFGVVHAGYQNPLHVLLPFAFGILMGIVFRWAGLLPAIYVHTSIDIFAFGGDAIENHPWFSIPLTLFFFFNFGLAIYVVVQWIRRKLKNRPQKSQSIPAVAIPNN